jgi:hypothetical protein
MALHVPKVSAVARLQRRGAEGAAAAAAGQQPRLECCSESSTWQAGGVPPAALRRCLFWGGSSHPLLSNSCTWQHKWCLVSYPAQNNSSHRRQNTGALGVTPRRAAPACRWAQAVRAHVPGGRAGRPPCTTFSPALGSARGLHQFSRGVMGQGAFGCSGPLRLRRGERSFYFCRSKLWLVSCSSSLLSTGDCQRCIQLSSGGSGRPVCGLAGLVPSPWLGFASAWTWTTPLAALIVASTN